MAISEKIIYCKGTTKEEYYQKNKEKRKLNRINNRAKFMIRQIKQRAKLKNLEFDLDENWVNKKLNKGTCDLTNLKFDLQKPKKGYYANTHLPSIDRKNPKKGYTKRNSQIILWCINQAKSEWNITDWKLVRKAIGRIK